MKFGYKTGIKGLNAILPESVNRGDKMKLILASSSPRRIELLRKLGLEFEVMPPIWETKIMSDDPVEVAEYIALEKARAVAGFLTEGIVIGADTIVYVDGRMLGKPKDVEEAKMFLRMLSGKVHDVITGIALINAANNREIVDHEITKVKFRELSDEEINWYVSTGEPLDKAGAYAIQGLGCLFIEKIEGDFFNVVGLPLAKLYVMLKQMGYDILRKIKRRKHILFLRNFF